MSEREFPPLIIVCSTCLDYSILCFQGIPNIRRVFGVLDFLNEKTAEGQSSSFNKWLIEHIQRKKLTNFLSFLFSDTEHIENCYEPSSFIRSEGCQKALMTCVLVIESGLLNHLKTIDLELTDVSHKRQGHRRSSSTPHMPFVPSTSSTRKSILASSKKKSRTFDFPDEKIKVAKQQQRKWSSLPNLYQDGMFTICRPRSKTISLRNQNTKFQKKVSFKNEIVIEATEAVKTEDVPFFEYRDSIAIMKPTTDVKLIVPIHNVVHVEDIEIHTDYRYSPEYQKSPTSSRPTSTPKTLSMFSFLDQTANSSKVPFNSSPSMGMGTSPSDIFFNVAVVPGSKIHFTSPIVESLEHHSRKQMSSRQNLNYFLQTIKSTSRQKVALDRENAHFHLSEAIIAASQQLKMNKMLNEKYKISKGIKKDKSELSPPQTTPQAPAKFTVGSVDDESDDESLNDEASSKRTNSTSSDDINVNVPHMEWNIADDPHAADPHSAESIAMILMSKFKNQRLLNPIWMVNEAQAPQQLLPFPDSLSYPVNPDDSFHLNTFIRGSKDWAPPRQQFIFTVHPTPNRRQQCQKQLNRCAGCGMKVQVQYIHTFRFCDYIGKYFCSACHKNQISSIPARVLDKWDFSLYPVSNFAYRWLDQIWNLPLYPVADLNPQLYEKAMSLTRAREARLQLKYIQVFIEQCRFAEEEQGFCKEIPSHWTEDVDIWSMTDFVDTKNNIFTERIREIIGRLDEHVTKNHCEVSLASPIERFEYKFVCFSSAWHEDSSASTAKSEI